MWEGGEGRRDTGGGGMGRDSSEAVELTDEVFLGETGPLAKGYRIDKDDGVVSPDVLRIPGPVVP